MTHGITLATVERCVQQALRDAREIPIEATAKKELHAARSRNFVACLSGRLHELHSDDPDVRAFTKHDDRNRAEFGMNELLYDVTVCRTATTTSAAAGKVLHYVAAPIWHVESELKNNSRQALFDFNKLVLGAAPLNLFVGPLVHDSERFVDVLRAPASGCIGSVFVALIPHPSEWDHTQARVHCEKLK